MTTLDHLANAEAQLARARDGRESGQLSQETRQTHLLESIAHSLLALAWTSHRMSLPTGDV